MGQQEPRPRDIAPTPFCDPGLPVLSYVRLPRHFWGLSNHRGGTRFGPTFRYGARRRICSGLSALCRAAHHFSPQRSLLLGMTLCRGVWTGRMQHAIIQKFCTGSPTRRSMSGRGGHDINYWRVLDLALICKTSSSLLTWRFQLPGTTHQVLPTAPRSSQVAPIFRALPLMTAAARFHRREIAISA